jgi:hypothetical protein
MGRAGEHERLERPSLDRRQLLVEEGVRVGDRLGERSREGVVQDPAPVRTGHPPHPAVDRPRPVAGPAGLVLQLDHLASRTIGEGSGVRGT